MVHRLCLSASYTEEQPVTDTPLVSVLTPAYNAESFFKETVDAVLIQTYANLEYIIVEDRSTDRTWDLVQEVARIDSRIRIDRNERNLGIAGTRNRCVSEARGKYVVWQDADDISLPQRVERLVGFMEKHPDVGICGSYLQIFSVRGDLEVRRYPVADAEIRKCIFRFSPISQPTAIIRRSCYAGVGAYDSRYVNTEDLDMTFRLGMQHRLANVPEVLLRYREHGGSTTATAMRAMLKDTLQIRRKYNGQGEYRMGPGDWCAWAATSAAFLIPARVLMRLYSMQRALLLRRADA